MTTRTYVVVGGVAGGASAAARLRRLDSRASIIVLERSGHVSFANCGLPYHISGTIRARESLLLQTPQSLRARFGLDVRVRSEVTAIDRQNRRISVRDHASGEDYELAYDALVLSPGASPVIPPIPGRERGFSLRTVEDLDRIKERSDRAKDVVIVGGGFIGLEVAENLAGDDRRVTVVELAGQVLAPLDPEMSAPVLAELRGNGVDVLLRTAVERIQDGKAVLDDGRHLPADLVLFAIGVRPESELAAEADLRIGPNGGILVDEYQRTSDPHIWAVGDAVEKVDALSGESTLVPLANRANREGRRAADAIAGIGRPAPPALGTAIVRVFGLSAAVTGWSEKRLRAAGRDFMPIHSHPLQHVGYYPGARPLALKLLVDPDDGTLLGAQAVGSDGADKRIDVIATAMRAGLSAIDLIDLELAYAPQFGAAKDPVNMLGYVAENRLSGRCRSADWSQVQQMQADGWSVLDVRDAAELGRGTIPGSVHIPLNELRDRMSEIPDDPILVHCAAGQRSQVAMRLLADRGRTVRNIDGGFTTWQAGQQANAAAGRS